MLYIIYKAYIYILYIYINNEKKKIGWRGTGANLARKGKKSKTFFTRGIFEMRSEVWEGNNHTET